MDTTLQVMTHAFVQAPVWIEAFLALVGGASAVAAVTPTPRDDHFIGQVYKLIDLLALNVGRAKDLPPNHL